MRKIGLVPKAEDRVVIVVKLKGKVERRGLCGDVFLVGTPRGPTVADISVDTSR